MSVAKPKQCVCGKYPSVEMRERAYSRGRYKACSVTRVWKANCRGCRRFESAPSKKEVIQKWNAAVLAGREKRDAPDKLVYALQSSGTHSDLALVRLLAEVATIKERLNI